MSTAHVPTAKIRFIVKFKPVRCTDDAADESKIERKREKLNAFGYSRQFGGIQFESAFLSPTHFSAH